MESNVEKSMVSCKIFVKVIFQIFLFFLILLHAV